MHGRPGTDALSKTLAPLDVILERHAAALGGDFTACRHHACRVATRCASQASEHHRITPFRRIRCR
jgi:hypothetical protein